MPVPNVSNWLESLREFFLNAGAWASPPTHTPDPHTPSPSTILIPIGLSTVIFKHSPGDFYVEPRLEITTWKNLVQNLNVHRRS